MQAHRLGQVGHQQPIDDESRRVLRMKRRLASEASDPLAPRLQRSPHLAGHWRLPELLAEVEQRVERLLARGRCCDDLRKMKGREGCYSRKSFFSVASVT